MKDRGLTVFTVLVTFLYFGFFWALHVSSPEVLSERTHQLNSCEDALFQRTLSFKLDDWEMRARKKLGDQWSCYEIGEMERFFTGSFSTLKVRIVFVLKKKEEVIK